MLQSFDKKKEIAIHAIKKIPLQEAHFHTLIAAITFHVEFQGGKVVTSGIGKAGQVAYNLGTTLSSTGTPSVFLHPTEALHGDLGMIQENDILVLVSNSGKTKEVLELIDHSRDRFPAIPIFAILGNPHSPLAKKVTGYLETGNPEEICPFGLTPTISVMCMNLICSLLVTGLMEAIQFSKEEYAKRHPSGSIGEVIKLVD